MAKSNETDANPPAAGKRSLFTRRPKAAAQPKKTGRLKQIAQVFQMTRKQDPNVVWVMLLAFLGIVVVGLVVGLLIQNWITTLIISIPLGLLAATYILSRRAERAAFSQIEGQPGAAGAALSVLRRGWIVQEQPVAVNPRTQDAIFRAIGRPGVVLVTEGPESRIRTLVETERRRLNRVLPNVTVHVVQTGREEGQIQLSKVARHLQKMKKELTTQEVSAVDKRLGALGSSKLPIPKGIDPYKARPDRKAAKGR